MNSVFLLLSNLCLKGALFIAAIVAFPSLLQEDGSRDGVKAVYINRNVFYAAKKKKKKIFSFCEYHLSDTSFSSIS